MNEVEKPYIWDWLDFDNPEHRYAIQHVRAYGFWPAWVYSLIRSGGVVVEGNWLDMCNDKYIDWLKG